MQKYLNVFTIFWTQVKSILIKLVIIVQVLTFAEKILTSKLLFSN